MSTVLVTGAAGFIGSHVTERLLARGERVVGLDNFDSFYARAVKEENIRACRSHSSFAFSEVDIRSSSAVLEAFEKYRPPRVVHLAAKAGVRPSIAQPSAYVETNIGGTLNLLRACERYSVRHLVFGSSSSVYGAAAVAPFSEDGPTDRPESPYAATKKAGEELCYTYHRLLGMDVTCLRFFTVFGPRQRPDLAIHKFVRLIDAGEAIPFYGDGSTSRDYTYVEDIVEGILAALDRPAAYAVYNLGRSDPVSLHDMVRAIETALGKRAILDHQPEQAGDVRRTYADIERARVALGYTPKVSFEEGIRRFVGWFRRGAW